MIATRIDAMTQGVQVYWDAKPTSHARLLAALERQSLGELCPPPYSVGESLKRAMADYCRRNRKSLLKDFDGKSKISIEIKRHESANEDGYEAVAVFHGKDRNTYTRLFACKVDVNGASGPSEICVLTDGWGCVDSMIEIGDAYTANRHTVSASAVGQMLVKAVKLLNGTCVREMGGLYYCPEGCADDWKMLCEAVEEKGGTQITWYHIELNLSASRSITAGINKEITSEVAAIMDEINSGALGVRAIDNRILRAKELRAKARQYEEILGNPLEEVRRALEDAETAAATASMLAAAKAEMENAEAA